MLRCFQQFIHVTQLKKFSKYFTLILWLKFFFVADTFLYFQAQFHGLRKVTVTTIAFEMCYKWMENLTKSVELQTKYGRNMAQRKAA